MQPVDARVRVREGADEQVLADVCHLPGGALELRTRSNMLSTPDLDVLRRCPRARVLLRPPLLTVHREQLERAPRAEALFELRQDETLDWAQVSKLGPRRLYVRVAGVMSEAQAQSLSRLRNVVLELDARGRVPTAEEVARWRALDHADKVLRLGPDTPPALVGTLKQLRLLEVVIESRATRVPPELLAALIEADLPTRVSLSWPLTPADLAPLTALRRLALEVDLPGEPDILPRGLTKALRSLGPAASVPHPDGGFVP